MCDIALILLDEADVQKAADSVKSFLNIRQQAQLDVLLSALKDNNIDTTAIAFTDDLIAQYRKNYEFSKKRELRFIVTANMSSGKSTLINALIGKPLARTSQEVCTGNVCYLYNKPFEDNHTHLLTSQLNLDASSADLTNYEWGTRTSISSHFRILEKGEMRICIIDTPGVNSAVNRKHGKIAREALGSENYDKLIYVLNANKLGTDEEIKHLRWVSENIPKEKIIFVLNKLDDFKCVDDNIQASIEGVRNDLLGLGYENPIICPLSAYFAFLTKLKHSGEPLTDDEEDEYTLYKKKFSKPVYDLSKYYAGVQCNANDSENLSMGKKSGLYGLEKILFGGLV